jgi:HEPN domain-containing protein
MPPEQAQPGSAQEWLRYAASDLELAKMAGVSNVMIESLCYHAQQCAEKAMKAVLVSYHVPVQKTHNIGLLLDLLSGHVAVPKEIEEAAILTDYAVMCRYPGDTEPITLAEYEQAVHLADATLVWAKQVVE